MGQNWEKKNVLVMSRDSAARHEEEEKRKPHDQGKKCNMQSWHRSRIRFTNHNEIGYCSPLARFHVHITSWYEPWNLATFLFCRAKLERSRIKAMPRSERVDRWNVCLPRSYISCIRYRSVCNVPLLWILQRNVTSHRVVWTSLMVRWI